jgi:hypothetical protein
MRDSMDLANGVAVVFAEREEFRCQCQFGQPCQRRCAGEDFMCEWCSPLDKDGHQKWCNDNMGPDGYGFGRPDGEFVQGGRVTISYEDAQRQMMNPYPEQAPSWTEEKNAVWQREMDKQYSIQNETIAPEKVPTDGADLEKYIQERYAKMRQPGYVAGDLTFKKPGEPQSYGGYVYGGGGSSDYVEIGPGQEYEVSFGPEGTKITRIDPELPPGQ